MGEDRKDQWRNYRRTRAAFFTVSFAAPVVSWLLMPHAHELRIIVVALIVGLYLPTLFVLSMTLRF